MRRTSLLLALAAFGCAPAGDPPSPENVPQQHVEEEVMSPSGVQSLEAISKLEFSWGWIRWMMNSQIDPNAEQTFGIVELNPGQQNPLHSHPNCEELLYVVSGSCRKTVGDKTHLMQPGDLVRIPTGVPHRAVTVGEEPMLAVIVYSSADRQMVIHEE